MTETKKVKVHKQITTYEDICGHRTTVSLVSVSDKEMFEYRVIKTLNILPKYPCVWRYEDYAEAIKEFKRLASEVAGLC